jgi:hypothetical protein
MCMASTDSLPGRQLCTFGAGARSRFLALMDRHVVGLNPRLPQELLTNASVGVGSFDRPALAKASWTYLVS